MSNPYGKELDWRVDAYRVEEVTGAVTLEVVKEWAPILEQVNGQLVLPSYDPPPVMKGYTRGAGQWKRLKSGGMGLSFDYKGVEPAFGGGVEAGASEFTPLWRLSGSLYQKDIRTALNWLDLKAKYGWNDIQKEFPELLPATTNGTSGYGGTSDPKLSPVYGQKSIDEIGGTLTKTYITASIGSVWAALNRANQIVDVPWALLGKLKDRNWKYGTPDCEPHGLYFRIVEKLELSGPGGWNPDFYKKAAKS